MCHLWKGLCGYGHHHFGIFSWPSLLPLLHYLSSLHLSFPLCHRERFHHDFVITVAAGVIFAFRLFRRTSVFWPKTDAQNNFSSFIILIIYNYVWQKLQYLSSGVIPIVRGTLVTPGVAFDLSVNRESSAFIGSILEADVNSRLDFIPTEFTAPLKMKEMRFPFIRNIKTDGIVMGQRGWGDRISTWCRPDLNLHSLKEHQS